MKLHAHTAGDGFPVLLLHGILGSSDNWHPVNLAMAKQFKVHTLDLRNHGRSPHSDTFNYSAMAEDLAEFLDGENLSKAHVVGHSMGGKVAMWFALTHPARVERLVVSDIAPKAYPPLHDGIIRAMLDVDPSHAPSRTAVGEALAAGVPNPIVRQFLLKNLVKEGDGPLRWRLHLPGIHRNYPRLTEWMEKPARFDGPTLFVRGTRSEYILPGDEPTLKKWFPHATLVALDAGHWIHSDAPEPFTRTVLDFLKNTL